MKNTKTLFLIMGIIVVVVIVLAFIFLNLEEPKKYLLVVNADSGSSSESTLTLNNVTSVIVFSNRPERTAGQIKLDDLTGMWNANFSSDPPNAELSVLGIGNAVVELLNPQAQGDNISFNIRIIEGEIPSNLESSSLFIDDVTPSDSIESFHDNWEPMTVTDDDQNGSNIPIVNPQITD